MRGDLLHRLCAVALITVASFALAGSGHAKSPTIQQMTAFSTAVQAHNACLMSSVEHYARRTTEPAATVIEAAIGTCQGVATDQFIRAMELGLTPEQATKNVRESIDQLRPLMTKKILDVRFR